MLCVDKDLQEIYDEAMVILKEHESKLLMYSKNHKLEEVMHEIKRIKINNKVGSRRGQWSQSKATIEISGYILTYPKKEIITTMVHELLHTFKDSRGHKGNWKLRANILKQLTGLNITRVRTIECEAETDRINERTLKLANKTTYKCRCKKCGTTFTYYKYTKFISQPELYRHKNCGGNFERVF